MIDEIPISGLVGQGFASVRDVFAANFASDDDLGASFSVYVDGELQVDLCGGFTNRKKQELWTEQTCACVYSTGKAVLAFLIAREVSNGRLDYDQPVATYWPEFGTAGKEAITVAEALSHQAGLCAIAEEMPPADWLNWDLICSRIAAAPPLWEPRTASGYGPQTFGFIAGELLKRTTGLSVGNLLRRDIQSQNLQLFCGLTEEQLAASAQMLKPPKAPDLGELNEFTKLAFLKPWSAPAKVAREDWAAAEIPASNMHANARSLAALMSPFADNGAAINGEQVLTPETIEKTLAEQINGPDLVLPFTLSWAAGVMRNRSGHFGPSDTAFGHAGFGGSCIAFDPRHNLSVAYVMNKMSPHLVGDPRALRLIEAVYQCL